MFNKMAFFGKKKGLLVESEFRLRKMNINKSLVCMF